MDSFNIKISDIARSFNAAPQVEAMGYAPDAFSNFKGVHPSLDVAVRLSCPLAAGVEVIDGVEHTLAFPHVVAKLPGTFHESRIPARREVFYFTYPTGEREALARLGFAFPTPCWEIRLSPLISELIRRIGEEAARSYEVGAVDRIDILCLELLEALILADAGRGDPERHNEDKIRKIASYIRLHYNEGLSLDRLISGHGLSRRSFFRYWRMFFALSPSDYIMDLKMREACQMLSQSDERVDMIADRLKFLNSTYFCRMFKKRFGATPLQYRKKGG